MFSVVCFLMLSRLFIAALWSPADLLALVGDVYSILVTFPCGILGQVWYLIVSFPDLAVFLTFILFYIILILYNVIWENMGIT